jgi:hypothetical protein
VRRLLVAPLTAALMLLAPGCGPSCPGGRVVQDPPTMVPQMRCSTVGKTTRCWTQMTWVPRYHCERDQ